VELQIGSSKHSVSSQIEGTFFPNEFKDIGEFQLHGAPRPFEDNPRPAPVSHWRKALVEPWRLTSCSQMCWPRKTQGIDTARKWGHTWKVKSSRNPFGTTWTSSGSRYPSIT